MHFNESALNAVVLPGSKDGMGEILGLPASKRTSPPSMGASETTWL